jgi:hypothetical protein
MVLGQLRGELHSLQREVVYLQEQLRRTLDNAWGSRIPVSDMGEKDCARCAPSEASGTDEGRRNAEENRLF